jgi:putative transposase
VSAFIDEHRARFGVEPICRILGVSASAYYERATGRVSTRRAEDARLLERIEQLHAANYSAYGYRKTWLALVRGGETVGRDRVKRLMRAAGIRGAKRRGKPWRTTTTDAGADRPPDLVDRDFTAIAPNQLCLADFTYLRCWQGVVFFSFIIIDAFSRRIVGWQFSQSMHTSLVLDALRMALTRRPAGAAVELITTPTPAPSTPATPSNKCSPTITCWPRSARSATHMTTPWPKASSIPPRPS